MRNLIRFGVVTLVVGLNGCGGLGKPSRSTDKPATKSTRAPWKQVKGLPCDSHTQPNIAIMKSATATTLYAACPDGTIWKREL